MKIPVWYLLDVSGDEPKYVEGPYYRKLDAQKMHNAAHYYKEEIVMIESFINGTQVPIYDEPREIPDHLNPRLNTSKSS